METTIEVDVHYDETEIKKAISCYILRVRGIRTYALIVYPVIFIASILSFLSETYVLLGLIYLLGGVILYCLYYQRPIEGYLKFYRKRKGGHYTFATGKILAVGDEIRSEYLWSVFKKAYEIPSAFLFLDDNKFVYIFPKSCFSEESAVVQMRSLVDKQFVDFKKYI